MAITVRDLINLLKKEDPQRVIVCSSDSEGNDLSLLEAVSTASYNIETGEFGLEELTEEMKSEGFGEEDVLKNGKPALILVPIR